MKSTLLIPEGKFNCKVEFKVNLKCCKVLKTMNVSLWQSNIPEFYQLEVSFYIITFVKQQNDLN